MFSLNVFRIPGASLSDEMVMRFLVIDMDSSPRALGWSWRGLVLEWISHDPPV